MGFFVTRRGRLGSIRWGEIAERVVALTLADPPGETTHWTGALMAKASAFQRQLRPTNLARPWPRAAPGSPVQALERPAVRRQVARRGRALCRSASARHRLVRRRKEPDSGARPHPARPAAQEGPRRHHDARLQTAWHDDAVRRAQHARRHGDRPQHAASSPSGVHPLPKRHRAKAPAGKTIHAIVDNYADTQTSKSAPMAGRHPAGLSTSPQLLLMAQRRRGIFRKLTKRRLKRGVFRSVVDLQAAINRFLKEHNQQSKPFTWTADPDKIIAAIKGPVAGVVGNWLA